MKYLCGLKNSRYIDIGKLVPHLDFARTTHATTVREAINEYEQLFNVKIEPMLTPFQNLPQNQGKYFWFFDNKTQEKTPVDIHIFRQDQEICPKQDLDFELLDGDIFEIGILIC